MHLWIDPEKRKTSGMALRSSRQRSYSFVEELPPNQGIEFSAGPGKFGGLRRVNWASTTVAPQVLELISETVPFYQIFRHTFHIPFVTEDFRGQCLRRLTFSVLIWLLLPFVPFHLFSSSTNLYRADYNGQGELGDRQMYLGQFWRNLQRLADQRSLS
jgi:hypothetical protein